MWRLRMTVFRQSHVKRTAFDFNPELELRSAKDHGITFSAACDLAEQKLLSGTVKDADALISRLFAEPAFPNVVKGKKRRQFCSPRCSLASSLLFVWCEAGIAPALRLE